MSNNKSKFSLKDHYHFEMEDNKPKTSLSANQWFKVLSFCVFFLVFVGLAWALSSKREIPSFSSLIDLIRRTPSVDVEFFIVTDDVFSWLKTIPLSFNFEGALAPLNFLNTVINWVNSTIIGLKSFLEVMFMPLDLTSWLVSSITQLANFIFTFIRWLFVR